MGTQGQLKKWRNHLSIGKKYRNKSLKKMAVLKVFCFCFTPRKASLVLGCAGIIMSIMMIVPPCLILENHDFYFNEYIRVQKSYADSGVDIRDEDIPAIRYFNKVALASFVAYLVLFTFASIFMISGVAARKSHLIVPWLVVAFLTLLFFLIMSISAMFAIASIKALAVLFLAGFPLGFGVYFWLTVYSTFALFRGEETAKMVRSAIRPEGVNNNSGNGNRNSETGSRQTTEVVTGTSSTAETEETEVCSTTQREQRPSLPISTSSPTFSNVKETIQRTASGSPPPPYEAVAVDIDKEEEALRSGIERSALALKSRLEQPLMKNDSMDSTETGPSSDSASACTTQPLDQPLDAIMVSDAHTSDNAVTTTVSIEEPDDQPLLLDAISFSSSNSSSASKDLKTSQSQVVLAEIEKC